MARVWAVADGRRLIALTWDGTDGFDLSDGRGQLVEYDMGSDGSAVLGSVSDGPRPGHPPWIEAAPTGDVLIAGRFVWRPRLGRVRLAGMHNSSQPEFRPVGFTAGGAEVVGVSGAGRVTRWPIPPAGQTEDAQPSAESRPVFGPSHWWELTTAVSHDATRAATVGRSLRVLVAPVAARGPAIGYRVPDADRSTRLAFAPDNNTLAAARDGVVHLVDLPTRRVTALPGPPVRHFAFTPDSRRVVATHADGTAAVWESPAGKLVARYDWSAAVGALHSVAVAPDGLTAYAGGDGGRIIRWDLPD